MFSYAPDVRRLRWWNLGAGLLCLLVLVAGTQLLFDNAHLPSRWSRHDPADGANAPWPLLLRATLAKALTLLSVTWLAFRLNVRYVRRALRYPAEQQDAIDSARTQLLWQAAISAYIVA